MRKDALLQLLSRYNQEKKLWQTKDPRIVMLENFLNSSSQEYLDNADEISFSHFTNFLLDTYPHTNLASLFDETYLTSGTRAAELFAKIFATDRSQVKGYLGEIPKAGRLFQLANYFKVKDQVALSSCSFALYSEVTQIQYWKKKLLALGCNAALLEKIIETKTIHNFKNFYAKLLYLPSDIKAQDIRKLWVLLCLSGEACAFDYAINFLSATSNPLATDDLGFSVLHWVVWSGSLRNLSKALAIPGMSVTLTTDNLNYNIKHLAAACRNPEMLKAVLAFKSKEFFLETNLGDRITHLAAMSGCLESFKLTLKDKDFDPLALTKEEGNLLHSLAYGGNVEALKLALPLLKMLNPEATSTGGFTILHLAVYSKSLAMVKFIVETFHIDPRKANLQDENALHIAVSLGTHETLEYLLTLVSNKEALVTNDKGFNLAHLACLRACPKILKIVLAIPNLDLYALNHEGMNLLHLAAESTSIENVETCLALNINPLTADYLGHTILHHTAFSKSPKMFTRVMAIPGLDPFAKTIIGTNVLQKAILSGCVEMVDLIIKLIPKLTILDKTNDKRNAVHFAATSKSPEMFKKIIAMMSTLDPNSRVARTKNGLNAVHYAASASSVEMLEIALSIPNIDALAATDQGWNAMHFASTSTSLKLLQRVANIPDINKNAITDDGSLPAHLAARSGLPDNLFFCLNHLDNDKNARTIHNMNIIQEAAASNSKLTLNLAIANCAFSSGPSEVTLQEHDALMLAVRNNACSTFKLLLNSPQYSDKYDKYYYSHYISRLFELAIRKNSFSIFQFLLNNYYSHLQPFINFSSAAHIAADAGCSEILKSLLTLLNVSTLLDGYSLLQRAARSGSAKTLSLVLALPSANPLQLTEQGRNLFHLCVFYESPTSVLTLRQYIQANSINLSPEMQDAHGNDAFFYAAASNNPVLMHNVLTQSLVASKLIEKQEEKEEEEEEEKTISLRP